LGKIQQLLKMNPGIREHKGFHALGFGIPSPYTNTDDELGLVVFVLTVEDIKPIKQLFRERLGSSSRWGSYPIYYDIAETPKALK